MRALSKEVKISLVYTERLHFLVVNRLFYMRSTLKKMKGGRQKQAFLMKDWCFTIEKVETVSQMDLLEENSQLQKMVTELEHKVSDQAGFIKKMQTSRADNPAHVCSAGIVYMSMSYSLSMGTGYRYEEENEAWKTTVIVIRED